MSTELMSMALDLGAAENSLEHHGIKGQSWGKRNGPPYPLRANQLSKDEKKENPGGSNEQQKEILKSSGANKKNLIDRISDKHKQHVIQKKRAEAQKKREQTIKAKKQAEIDAAEKEKKRRDRLYKYSPEELLDHRLEYNDDELRDAIAKLRQANELQNVAIDTARRDNDMFAEQVKKSRRGAETLQTAITYGEKAIKIYDVIATLSGEPTLEQRAGMKLDLMKEEYRNQKNQQNQQNSQQNDKKKQEQKSPHEERQDRRQEQVERDLDKYVQRYTRSTDRAERIELKTRMDNELSNAKDKLDADRFAQVQTKFNSQLATATINQQNYKKVTSAAPDRAKVDDARQTLIKAYNDKNSVANPKDRSDPNNRAVATALSDLYSRYSPDVVEAAMESIPKAIINPFANDDQKKR